MASIMILLLSMWARDIDCASSTLSQKGLTVVNELESRTKYLSSDESD